MNRRPDDPKCYTLVYDETCPFCYTLAYWFRDNYKIKIVSNQKVKKDIGVPRAMLKRDVHLVIKVGQPSDGKWREARMVLHGADAAARLLAIRYPFIWKIYKVKPLELCFKSAYFILKKIRKYLYLVWR